MSDGVVRELDCLVTGLINRRLCKEYLIIYKIFTFRLCSAQIIEILWISLQLTDDWFMFIEDMHMQSADVHICVFEEGE